MNECIIRGSDASLLLNIVIDTEFTYCLQPLTLNRNYCHLDNVNSEYTYSKKVNL